MQWIGLAKNGAAERASAIATINAAPDVYGSDELGEMSTDQLAKLARFWGAQTRGNYGAQNAATQTGRAEDR